MQTFDALEHLTRTGERWDQLAWRYYGDPSAYGRIIEANPALDITPRLPGGVLILIPLLSIENLRAMHFADLAKLPPWKR